MKKTPRRAVLYELISKAPTTTYRPGRSSIPDRLQLGAHEPDAADTTSDDAHDSTAPGGPGFRIEQGRLSVSLNPATYVLVAGLVAAVLIAGYAMGRGAGHLPPTMTAMNEQAGAPTNPLLGESARPSPAPADGSGTKRAASDASVRPARKPDSSSAVKENPARSTATAAGKQTRLWIQSIKARSAAEKRVAAQEAEHIRVFLGGQGIKTRVVSVDNGVIVMSDEGHAGGAAGEADRAAFIKRVKQLGRIYRQQGGRFNFEGCFFPAD